MIKVVVFDFDGTLVESEGVKDMAFEKIFGEYGHAGQEALRYHYSNRSLPRIKKFDRLASLAVPEDRAGQAEICDRCALQFGDFVKREVSACAEVEGASALLRKLAERMPLYVASVNPEEELAWHLEQRNWIGCLRGWYSDPPTRKADALREIVRRERLSHDELVLVGDASGDADAAKEAGCNCWLRYARNGDGNWKTLRDVADRLGLGALS